MDVPTTAEIVLGMAHNALNNGRTAVEIVLQKAHRTRLMLRLGQIVLGVMNHPAAGNADAARKQLAELETDLVEYKPEPLEWQMTAVVRGMFDTATGPGPELREPVLMWMSRVFVSVSYGDYRSAASALDEALSAMQRG